MLRIFPANVHFFSILEGALQQAEKARVDSLFLEELQGRSIDIVILVRGGFFLEMFAEKRQLLVVQFSNERAGFLVI